MRTAIILLLLLTASFFSTAHTSFKNEPVFLFNKKLSVEREPVSPRYKTIFYAGSHFTDDSLHTAKIKRKAKWSKWLGIGSLLGLIIPGVNLLSLPAAIAAIIIGYQVKRDDHENKDAAWGLKTGWFTVGFLLVISFIVFLVTLPLGPR